MTRWSPWLALLVVVAAMASPVVLDPPPDDFPISTYPMFTADRGAPSAVRTAVGVTAADARHRLSPALLAGADEPILAVRTARVAVDSGRADDWCLEVARRVADDATIRAGERIVGIEVVTEVHDAAATLAAGADPLDVTLHAACRVPAP